MPTRIAVLELMDNHRVRVAWYYEIEKKQQLPGAVDASREPAGTRLSAQERQALKDGKLFELVKVLSVSGSAKDTKMAQRLEVQWAELQGEALAEYRRLYGLGQLTEHVAWDGSRWSRP